MFSGEEARSGVEATLHSHLTKLKSSLESHLTIVFDDLPAYDGHVITRGDDANMWADEREVLVQRYQAAAGTPQRPLECSKSSSLVLLTIMEVPTVNSQPLAQRRGRWPKQTLLAARRLGQRPATLSELSKSSISSSFVSTS